MAITRLNCPDCGTVLRPAKPVTPGKKVRCPNCDLIFVAGEDDEEEVPRRGRSSKAPKAKQTTTKKKEAPKEEETYGYIRDEDENEEKRKPRIEYAPDESIRDLRGPAIVKLTNPMSKLQLVGMICVLGWMALFLLLMIPTVFPVMPGAGDKMSPVMRVGPGLGAVDPEGGGGGGGFFPGFAGGGSGTAEQEKTYPEEKGGFFEFFGFDLSIWFIPLIAPLIFGAIYSAMVVGGGIKGQNLESRRWAIFACILAMTPLNTLGIQIVVSLILNYIAVGLLEDAEFGMYLTIGAMTILYLISLGVAIWGLKTLFDQQVIDGFEFKPD